MKIRRKSEEEMLKTKNLKNRDLFLRCKSKEKIKKSDLFYPAIKECVENKDLDGIIAVSTIYVKAFEVS